MREAHILFQPLSVMECPEPTISYGGVTATNATKQDDENEWEWMALTKNTSAINDSL
jgi:hypothetical protein